MPDNPAIAARKAELRRQLRAARRAYVASLTPEARAAQEAALAAQLLPHIRGAAVIASYAACGAEISLSATEDSLPGVRILFPRVAGRDLHFHACRREALVAGHRNIPEPPSDAPLLRPDILLVPLLAADGDGWRLGQGGGFYDRALAQLRASGGMVAIGVGWDMQLLGAVPHDAHDMRLDAIATPSAFRHVHAAATEAG